MDPAVCGNFILEYNTYIQVYTLAYEKVGVFVRLVNGLRFTANGTGPSLRISPRTDRNPIHHAPGRSVRLTVRPYTSLPLFLSSARVRPLCPRSLGVRPSPSDTPFKRAGYGRLRRTTAVVRARVPRRLLRPSTDICAALLSPNGRTFASRDTGSARHTAYVLITRAIRTSRGTPPEETLRRPNRRHTRLSFVAVSIFETICFRKS